MSNNVDPKTVPCGTPDVTFLYLMLRCPPALAVFCLLGDATYQIPDKTFECTLIFGLNYFLAPGAYFEQTWQMSTK